MSDPEQEPGEAAQKIAEEYIIDANEGEAFVNVVEAKQSLARAIDAHAREQIHREWLVTHAQHEAALAKDICPAPDEHHDLEVIWKALEELGETVGLDPSTHGATGIANAVAAALAKKDKALRMGINSLGDVARIGWGHSVDPKRWAEQLLAVLKEALDDKG